MTGAPLRAKMSVELWWWSAYFARACTGKWPWVRPVSEPTRPAGRPPMSLARSITLSTYQVAWL